MAVILLTTAPLSAQTNWGLAVAGPDFYFTDLNRGQILRLAHDGGLDVLIDDVHCHSLAMDYSGTLYAEAVGAGRAGMGEQVALWRLAPGGHPEHAMAPTSPPAPGMWIARDAAGNAYSWHGEGERRSRIFRRAPDGAVSVLAGDVWGVRDGVGAVAQFGHVGALAAAADGVLYVTDSGHLRRITPEGAVTTVARDLVSVRTGGLPGDFGLFNRTVGLAVGPGEGIVMADVYNLRVVRWHPADGAATLWDGNTRLSRVTGGGLAWRPLGVAVEGSDVYVLESLTLPRSLVSLVGTPRIVRVSSERHAERLATLANRPLQAAAVVLLAALAFCILRRRRRT